MRLSTEQMTELRNYCKTNIRNFEHKVSIVLDEMDEMRIPIEQCSTNLADDLWSCMEEWCDDKGIDVYEVDIELEELI